MRGRKEIISIPEYKTAYILDKVTERTLQRMRAKAKYNKRVKNRKKLMRKRGNKK